jgi:hypothetical protein
MQYNPRPICMLLIKDQFKITDAFQTALTTLESKHSVTVFKDIKLCLEHLKEGYNTATQILFFNLNDNGYKCLNEIKIHS